MTDDFGFVPDTQAPAPAMQASTNEFGFVPDKPAETPAGGTPAAPQPPLSGQNQSESEYWHNMAGPAEDGNFPNVKDEGGILPIKSTYNPDGTLDESHVDFSTPIKNIARGVGDLYQQAENQSTETTPDAIRAQLAMTGIKPAFEGMGNLADEALEKQSGLFPEGETPSSVPKKILEAQKENDQNTRFVQGINGTLDKMKGVTDLDTGKIIGGYGEIYEKAANTIQDVSTKAPAAQKNVGDLLEEMNDDPAYKTAQGSSQAYRDLQAVYDSFDEDGNIPLDKVTLLKRRLNDLYSPDMGETRGAIYARLNNQVNNIIKQARKENPEWASLMDSGNNLFLNYKKTTDSLSNAWSVGDKKEYEDALRAQAQDPTAAPPAADIRQKMSLIAKPKNIQQYEDTMRVMPRELQDEYTKSVLENNPTNSRIVSGIKAIYKASIGNKFGAANETYNTIAGKAAQRIDPDIAEQYPHAEDAVNYHTKNAQKAFGDYLDKMYSAQNPAPPLALPAPATRLPAEQSGLYKALPAPNPNDPRFPMVNDTAKNFGDPLRGPMRPMTQSELENYIAKQQSKSPEISTSERAAQQDRADRARAERDKRAWESYRTNPRGQSDLMPRNELDKPLQSYPEDVPAFLRGQFARGGTVNKEPTEAQKTAGNYKKGHVKVHGLDISIENPKGSERSGETKDGEKWRSTMGADYGYIKRTQGADGDHVDCYLGTNMDSKRIYVMDQLVPENGEFDEHKCFIDFSDRDAAIKAYRDSFTDKKVNKRIGHVRRMSIPEFKDWLKSGKTKQPVRKAA